MKIWLKFFFVSGLCLGSAAAQAGYLRIVSDSQLYLIEKNGQIFLEGAYSLENQGDEVARNVFPKFKIDQAEIILGAFDLQPNQKHTWALSEEIPPEKLCLQRSVNCSIIQPSAGDFLVQVEKNYSDNNRYPFAVPDILSLSYKKSGSAKIGSDLVRIQTNIRQLSQAEYVLDFQVENLQNTNIQAGTRFLLPQEVVLLTPLVTLEIQALKTVRGTINFQNRKGLEGSDYLALFVVELVESGQRKFAWSTSRFRIERFAAPMEKPLIPESLKKNWGYYLWGLAVVLPILFFLGCWGIPVWRLKKNRLSSSKVTGKKRASE